jgi:DNA polymerase III subunit epsilon
MVFVDLETTGATATADRITEIGIVEVNESGVSEWSALINPETRIPEFIEQLTGITNHMVVDAPAFDAIADEVLERLQGKLFIAHNARFDYGFLKNEFKRAQIDFRATVLCTVKLSRRLYPLHARHNLDALIQRHGLKVSDRHRALGDARLIWQFWQQAIADHGSAVIEEAIAALTARPSLPQHLDARIIDELPEGHGVYLFYAENDLPLYIGKSNTLRRRVLSHFGADHASAKEMNLSQQVRRIDWIETAGELGALLKEAELVKKLQPTHNHRLRQNSETCSLRLLQNKAGNLMPKIELAREMRPENGESFYGLFKNQRAAKQALKSIAGEQALCLAIMGLEKVVKDHPCFAYQLHRCRGACLGRESVAQHNLRLITALQKIALKTWPYSGPVGIREGDKMHIVDHWRYLGTASSDTDMGELLSSTMPAFDADNYKLLVKFIGKRNAKIVKLS